MASDVISHTEPRRKRGRWGPYIARRLLALTMTVAAIITASWLGPMLRTPPAPPHLPELVDTRAGGPSAEAMLFDADVALDLAAPPAPARAQIRRTRRSVPLDAAGDMIPDSYEILSAAELDAISQARD